MSAKKTNTHTYIAVLKIEGMQVGGTYNHELHCTLLHWFKSSGSRDDIKKACELATKEAKSITLVSTQKADFVDERNSIIYLVEKTAELTFVHTRFIEELKKVPGFELLEPRYSFENWQPHVTSQDGKSFLPGQIAETSSIYLIEARDGDIYKNPKDVFAEIRFGYEATA